MISPSSAYSSGLFAVAFLSLIVATGDRVPAVEPPSPKLCFSFQPVQKNIEYEIVPEAQYSTCKVRVERRGKGSGWVVEGPSGQVLRRFVDTNDDNLVDEWRYYQHGLEVYRDIDSNFNNKVDQARWLNSGGTRWGLDENEDGKIDRWKAISAHEAAHEAVQALIDGNVRALEAVCITADDIKQLGINEGLSAKLQDSTSNLEIALRKAVAGSKILTKKTRWLRFDATAPGIIPADEGKATQDLLVHENTMAIVEVNEKSELVQIGEIVRVGDTWKLTQIPKPLEGSSIEVTAGGILMQPIAAAAGTSTPVTDISPKMQKLLEELQKLDQNSPTPTDGANELARYHAQRADLLKQLVELAKTDEERAQWIRQMVDGIAASVQTGAFPDGMKRLDEIESQVKKKSATSDLFAYVSYRKMLAKSTVEMQSAKATERSSVQERWLKSLSDFVEKFPNAEDTPDAVLQLAIADEFSGKASPARERYRTLVDKYADSNAGKRAVGALRRMDLEGKTFDFSGKNLAGGDISGSQFKGKVLLVIFWSTWCRPCTEDLPQIRALLDKHRADGFEILGINLDTGPEPVAAYMKEQKMTWPQIHEPGGLESRPAVHYGIITLPTMFLVGKDGKVISRAASVEDLKERLPELLDKK